MGALGGRYPSNTPFLIHQDYFQENIPRNESVDDRVICHKNASSNLQET
jgi:hypothetical protein